MDRNTLSQYGWLIIALVFTSIIIFSLTPYGQFLESNLYSNAKQLFGLADVKPVYAITVETSVYGTVKTIEKSEAGETVEIDCTPYTGFEYDGAEVITKSGNTIELSKSAVTFEMPDEPVTIRVKYAQIL